jgi:hypothetical protein
MIAANVVGYLQRCRQGDWGKFRDRRAVAELRHVTSILGPALDQQRSHEPSGGRVVRGAEFAIAASAATLSP